MPTYMVNGHKISFAQDPSEEDIDEAAQHFGGQAQAPQAPIAPAPQRRDRFELKSSQPYSSYSYLDAAKDTGKTAINSLANLGENTLGTIKSIPQIPRAIGHAITHLGETASGIASGISNKVGEYNSMDKFANKVATDPFGFGSDVVNSVGIAAGARNLAKKAMQPNVGKLTAQATKEYRTILRPTQGEVKNIEIRGNKNVDDMYTLAAEEQLPIKQTKTNNRQELDTLAAREKLTPRQEQLHQKLNEELAKDPNQQFDLKNIGRKAKAELRTSIKNDTEFKNAAADIDEQINDAINARGRFVTGSDLNNFKQGMWSVGYNQLKPTAQSTARKIGFIAKEAIEKAYPNSNIAGLNELSGKYATLNHLLENAHGRVVAGGRLGKYVANTIGAVAGSKIPVVGPILGAHVGGKVSDFIYAPARASASAAAKAGKAGISGKSFKETMNRKMPSSAIPMSMSMKYSPKHINRIVDSAGGKVKGITSLDNSLYPDEPTIYMDFPTTQGTVATITIRPSELSIANIKAKLPKNVTTKTSQRDLRYYRQRFKKMGKPDAAEAVNKKIDKKQ